MSTTSISNLRLENIQEKALFQTVIMLISLTDRSASLSLVNSPVLKSACWDKLFGEQESETVGSDRLWHLLQFFSLN